MAFPSYFLLIICSYLSQLFKLGAIVQIEKVISIKLTINKSRLSEDIYLM